MSFFLIQYYFCNFAKKKTEFKVSSTEQINFNWKNGTNTQLIFEFLLETIQWKGEKFAALKKKKQSLS
jgi:hypothetical protein